MMRPKLFALICAALLSGVSTLHAQDAEAAFIIVKVEEEAVKTGPDGKVEVLMAGLHFYDASKEEVAVYATHPQRVYEIPAAFMMESCPVDLTLRYSVGDVLAFHEAGGDFDLISAAAAEVADIMKDETVMFETPLSPVLDRIHTHLEEALTGGFSIWQVQADRGTCGPQPPRIALREEPVALPVVADATSGAQTVEMYDLLLLTTDDRRLRLDGAVARFDVSDSGALYNCFGDGWKRNAGHRVELIVQTELRRAAGTLPMADFTATLGSFADQIPQQATDVLTSCGLSLRAVDFSAATLTQLIGINCDERPDEAECQP